MESLFTQEAQCRELPKRDRMQIHNAYNHFPKCKLQIMSILSRGLGKHPSSRHIPCLFPPPHRKLG